MHDMTLLPDNLSSLFTVNVFKSIYTNSKEGFPMVIGKNLNCPLIICLSKFVVRKLRS